MLQAAKDAMTSRAALSFLNREVARYGEVLELRINSREKTVEASCRLRGESEPVDIRVGHYEIESAAGRSFVRATGFTSNRPWLQSLLTDFMQNRPFELPPWAAEIL